MKKILLLLFVGAISMVAHAQTTDTLKTIGIHPSHQVKFNQPLCFLDGKKFSADSLSTINASSIDSIHIIKGQEAKSKYGDAGKNGVLIITLKEVARKEE